MAPTIGQRNTLITIEVAGTPQTDAGGGYTQAETATAPPRAWARVTSASQRNIERLVANTVTARATHLVELPWQADVTNAARISWTDRGGQTHTANVTSVTDVDARGIDLVLTVVETP